MKRFIISIMCISVFFIGIGSIIETTSAKFKSDEKALEIIRQVRIAIGGDSNLAEVRSMTVVGSSTHFFEKDGIQNSKQGNLEINMQFPGQFSKIVRIGDPNNAANGDAEIRREVEVLVKESDGNFEFTSEDGKKKGVFVFKKGDGANSWTAKSDGKIKVDGNKIVITKDDGTTEEINIEGKHKIRVKKDTDGNILTEDIDADIDGFDGEKVIVVKNVDGEVISERLVGSKKIRVLGHAGHRQNEMLRTTIALLMTAPEGLDVSYKFAGQGNVDGNPSNIIDVSANGSSFKLFIDASSNLPQMVTYRGNKRFAFVAKSDSDNMSKEELIAMKTRMVKAGPTETQIKFSDFRNVGNLLLPHRWTESQGGKETQNTDITNFEINPANIADKFKGRKFIVKKTEDN